MSGLSRRRSRDVNTWPGFVDALATLLMVIIFLLMIFVVAQVYLGAALSGRDKALSDLTSQVNELTNLLSLERNNNQEMQLELTQLTTELSTTSDDRDALKNRVSALADKLSSAQMSAAEQEKKLLAALAALEDKKSELTKLEEKADETQQDQKSRIDELAKLLAQRASQLDDQKDISESARAQVEALNQQLLAVRQQLSKLQDALERSRNCNATGPSFSVGCARFWGIVRISVWSVTVLSSSPKSCLHPALPILAKTVKSNLPSWPIP
jgi:chemotaxis protein MotB